MLQIDADRFRESFESYSEIGATDDGGLHRLALTDADERVRETFVADLESLGLDVRVDAVGNVFGRREGTNPDADPVLVGSHLDSQPYGGRYDGQLGVLAALETLRTLDDEGIETDRPIEIVDWTNEEGSRFQHAMLGSGVFAGVTDLDEALALTDADGASLGEELERIGYAGDADVSPFDVHSHLELHVEQGPTLDANETSVGVVEGVFGMAWQRVTIRGESDHAGPSPMHTRTDAMAAAADAASELNDLPNRLGPDAVATIGEFSVEPDSVNVIPSRAEFTVDVRSYDDALVADAKAAIRDEVEAACRRHGTDYEIEDVWEIPHTEYDPEVRKVVADAAERADVSYERIVSGAGHDAKYVNNLAPTAMVFVPSVDGITHNEAEFTEWDDCVAGANVFANATVELATE
ncbi:Zn-dependent hydrolase [Halorussus marinus]|uniref:Zn-dependent hydrolase n=1 Tax=Halorussus marinus TaxID=2505976 RepID=UPI0010920977|nr:Zn-dependent hydrolase [Halorussus marinus]